MPWASHPALYLAALSRVVGRCCKQNAPLVLLIHYPSGGSVTLPLPLSSRTFYHSAFPAWADSPREEHLAVLGWSNSLSQKLKASLQPSSHWNWVTSTVAPGDSKFSDCRVFCVDSRFPEAWRSLKPGVSFDSLSDASTHLPGPEFYLYQWGLWLLLQTEVLYLILSRGKHSKMIQSVDSGARLSGLKSSLCHSMSWARHFIVLCLSFPTYKRKTISLTCFLLKS